MENYFATGKVKSEDFSSLSGRMLVATAALNDSIFEEALIFVCAHDSEGAVGVMFNKTVDSVSSKKLMEKFEVKKRFHLEKKYPVFHGGPVDEDKMFILSGDKDQKKHFNEASQLTLFTNAELFLKDVLSGKIKNSFLIIKGFCGWGAAQLEQEVLENSWIVTDVEFDAIFKGDAKKKWSAAIKKLGIKNMQNIVSYSGNA